MANPVGGGGGYWSGKKFQDLRSPEIGISEYGYYQPRGWAIIKKRERGRGGAIEIIAIVKNFKADVSSISP